MHLYDGWMVEVPTQHPEQMTRLFYKRDLLRVRNVTNTFQATDADSASKSDREMTVCEMQARFADVDYQWQRARYDREVAASGDEPAQRGAERPVAGASRCGANPFGLGRIYCSLLDRLFGVKTASAATVPPGGLATGPGRDRSRRDAGRKPRRCRRRSCPHRRAACRRSRPRARARSHRSCARCRPVACAPASRGRRSTTRDSTNCSSRARSSPRGRESRSRAIMRVRYDIEIQKKFSLAAACLIFVLLGPPIALRFPRGGVGLVIGVSFSVFALYYVGLIGGETLADGEIISPFWAMWGANMILLLVGIVMTLRMNRVSGATRGGDWTEIRENLRHLLRRLMGRAPRRAA